MKANKGDWVIVHAHLAGEPTRRELILDVHGRDGEPPYVVQWDDGHESTYFPASDAVIEQHAPSGPHG